MVAPAMTSTDDTIASSGTTKQSAAPFFMFTSASSVARMPREFLLCMVRSAELLATNFNKLPGPTLDSDQTVAAASTGPMGSYRVELRVKTPDP
jgi:hypothetical protein